MNDSSVIDTLGSRDSTLTQLTPHVLQINRKMEDFSKELGIVEKCLLRGEYPVGMTKADKGFCIIEKMWRQVTNKRIRCGEYVLERVKI